MVTCIVFSKDRPLQLHAWIESTMHHLGVPEESIAAIVRETPATSYDLLRRAFPKVRWIEETKFAENLSSVVSGAAPFVLWGCDDVVYKEDVDLSAALHALGARSDVACFSLRLGKNIIAIPNDAVERAGIIEWDWRRTASRHWNYPWEVSGSIYRKADVLRLLDRNRHHPSPNHLEGDIATLLEREKELLPPRMLAFANSKCVTVTVNRVQETHPNPFDSTGNHDVGSLSDAYRNGVRLDWRRLSGRANRDVHVGADWFILAHPRETAPFVKPRMPLVSIVCFVYNRDKYIEETVRSLLAQDYGNFEIVILNDGSRDGTQAKIDAFLADPRVRSFQQENIGQSGAFHLLNNRCIEQARGEYISWTGADDVYAPRKTSRQIAEFLADPRLDVVFSNGGHIDAVGRPLATDFRHSSSLALTPVNQLRNLYSHNFIPHPTVMMKREAYFREGCFEHGFASDYHFWMKTSLSLRYRYIDEKLLDYRFHDEGSSTKAGNPGCEEAIRARKIIRKLFGAADFFPEMVLMPDRRTALAEMYFDLALRSLVSYSDFGSASDDFERSLSLVDSAETRFNLGIVQIAAGAIRQGTDLLHSLEGRQDLPSRVRDALRTFQAGERVSLLQLDPGHSILARTMMEAEHRYLSAGRGNRVPGPICAPVPKKQSPIPCAPQHVGFQTPTPEAFASNPTSGRPSEAEVEHFLRKADAAIVDGRIEQGLAALKEAEARSPENLSIRNLREDLERSASVLRSKSSMLERSATLLSKAQKRSIDEADVRFANGDLDGALLIMRDPENDDPPSLVFQNAFAWLLARSDRLSEAQAKYLNATILWPDNPSTHSNLAGVLIQRGLMERAEAPLRKVLELRPDDPDAMAALVRVLHETGREADAVALAERYRVLHPQRLAPPSPEPESVGLATSVPRR